MGPYKNVPDWVSKTKGVINIQRTENDCFELRLLAALEFSRGTKDLQYIYKYTELKAEKKFNFNGISTPAQMNTTRIQFEMLI